MNFHTGEGQLKPLKDESPGKFLESVLYPKTVQADQSNL